MNLAVKIYKIAKRTINNAIRQIVTAPKWLADNIAFAYDRKHLKRQPKIVYALTPPPYLKNIGDHAQVIAIRAWLDRHFGDLEVLEMDKDRGHYLLPALRWLVTPEDVVFLHSGGNLGDRGKWSEGMRREIIRNFPRNQIVSLPQTIFFSDTPDGQKEQAISCSIYNRHPNLTVIGRDPRSGELAAELFPEATTFCMPDFVLSLPPRQSTTQHDSPQILLCLRLDVESALTPEQRQEIGDRLPYQCTYYDTTLEKDIDFDHRKATLDSTLAKFLAADVVVTDRYHGLIFTVLCQKPCVVLRTVDHKLTSAIHWFESLPHVMFAQDLTEVPQLVEQCLQIVPEQRINWSEQYFDKIPKLVGLD